MGIGAKKRKYAAFSVDVDTLMAEASVKGFDTEKARSIRKITYLKIVPVILDLFDELKIKATFFITGQDGLQTDAAKKICEIAGRGHEVANHSMFHERRLSSFNEKDFIEDVRGSAKILSDVTAKKISGFRMPGATINLRSLVLLEQMGYAYDSSLNPSVIYNLAKACLNQLPGNKENKIPFQDFKSVFAPREPYFPNRNNMYKSSGDNLRILEFPITVIPWLSFPFMNYFLLGAGKSVSGVFYNLVKAKRNFINFVMHDHEFAQWEDFRVFRFSCFFCGRHMHKAIASRRAFVKQVADKISRGYNVTTLEEYCRLVNAGGMAE